VFLPNEIGNWAAHAHVDSDIHFGRVSWDPVGATCYDTPSFQVIPTARTRPPNLTRTVRISTRLEPNMPDFTQRRTFLIVGIVFEAGLAAVALLLGWLVDVDPLEAVRFEPSAVAWGVAATLPLFLIFLVLFFWQLGPLQKIKQFLIDILGPPLLTCHWHELIGLALLVGFSEELLFRGVLQPWLANWGLPAGLIGSNLLFGLAHFVTPLYAVIAAVLGLFLGSLLQWPAEGNLLAPIITHALYDYLAFLVVIRAARQRAVDLPLEAEDGE